MAKAENEFSILMQRVRNGSQEAARELLEQYGPHIVRAVRRKLNRKLRAKFDSMDFVQDVWASFFINSPSSRDFETPEQLMAFLVNLARNKVIEEFRQRLQTEKHNLNREHSLDGSAAFQVERLVGPEPTGSQVFAAKERWDQMVEGQPDHYQKILDLLQEGKSYQEVAEQVGVHVKTVRRVVRKLDPRFLHD